MRNTRSFEQAFARAVPVTKQREIDAGKDGGFSRVGANIGPVLRAIEQRLDR